MGKLNSYALSYSFAFKSKCLLSLLTLSEEAGCLCKETRFLLPCKREQRTPEGLYVGHNDSGGTCDNASGNEFSNRNQMEDGQPRLTAFRCNGLNILDCGKEESKSDML